MSRTTSDVPSGPDSVLPANRPRSVMRCGSQAFQPQPDAILCVSRAVHSFLVAPTASASASL